MSFYEVKVVDRSGVVLATFDASGTRQAATVESVSWVLNEPGSATIRVPVHHVNAASIVALTTEVQVWRNGAIIFWGVPVQRDYDASSQSVVWTCPGLLWYFTRRYFGPISINRLTNPLFTSNLTGWTAVGCTATHSTAIRLRGPGTARLVSTSSGDNFLKQDIVLTTGGVGLFLAIAGWYWIDPGTAFTAGAFEERGIFVSSPSSLSDPAGSFEPINMNAKVGVPQRVETGIHLPALTTVTVTVRLYSPHGAIQWGATSATELESVSSEPAGTDATEMMARIVDYAQNGTGKSNLNIGWTTPASGTKEILAYQFADLGLVYDALLTYPARGLADFDMAITSTTRTFTTYAPRKGSHKAGYGVTVPGSSVLTMGHRLDGQRTSTKTIRRGAGDGSDRELGVSTDTAPLGGLVLEEVADVPPEITIDGLDGFAATELVKVKSVVPMLEATVSAASWLGNVVIGDTVPAAVNWGAVQDSSTRRVLGMTLSPMSDTIAVALGVSP